MLLKTPLAILSALVTVALAQVPPISLSGDTAVHDPTLCKDKNGKYFVFATAPGIAIRTSTDRITWTFEGAMWPNGAPWTDAYTGQSNANLWAPECHYTGSEFLVWYAASTGSLNSAIFLAKSSTGAPGSFTNLGLVTSTSTANDYNAIDPSVLIENGTWNFALGSYYTGIKYMTLDPSTGIASNSSVTSLARRFAADGAVEGSTIYKYGSYYYLFTSWDMCCHGTSSTYNIRVGRSSTVNGGYVDKSGVALTSGGGTLVLGSHGNIIGPGGQFVYTDNDGPILVYHYYTPYGSRLGINHLNFSSGWPVVV
ncbi:glycoside hydrolase family 43 protein [Hebeloma cylindrosporum]|uniref:arabinan endo-1,5-alpha-L-arabinosidase n=1 Tax=Hebeloma cylindrosporum TaxID=76867 RepID=A0A0C3CMX3_HEBCY|nr:glycoside hydrolase family 43 protein [Hebeloma cylindrosporum h7]